MSLDDQAASFLSAVYEAVAHGDDAHKTWLRAELDRWRKPLRRVLEEQREIARRETSPRATVGG